jgi:hypothetical protein
LIVAAVLVEQYPSILTVIHAVKEGSFMETVWNLDLYAFFKPVDTAVLNVMAGVTATLASSRILSPLRAESFVDPQENFGSY